MAYIKQISDAINEELQKQLFTDKRFDNRLMIGIAQSMPRINGDRVELLPCYVDDSGEGIYVGPDDDYNIIIYHRCNKIGVAKALVKGFGDTQNMDAHSISMSMVVFGKRDELRLSNEELAVHIHANMPEGLSKQMLSAMKFSACNIKVTEMILNDMQVFQEEYQNIPFFLKPEQFLLKINYTIESAFLKKCFNKCQC